MTSTCCLVGCNTQSILRSTVRGKITSWYLLRLKVSRIRSATLQIKLTFSLKLFMNLCVLPLLSLCSAVYFSFAVQLTTEFGYCQARRTRLVVAFQVI